MEIPTIDDYIEKAEDLKKEKRYKKMGIWQRLCYVMPKKGKCHLSGKHGTVIIYDEESQSYRDAILFHFDKPEESYNYRSQYFLAGEKTFSLEGYKIDTPIINREERGTPSEENVNKSVVHFLYFFLNLFEEFKSPVMQIGQYENRFFPFQFYSLRTDKIPTIE